MGKLFRAPLSRLALCSEWQRPAGPPQATLTAGCCQSGINAFHLVQRMSNLLGSQKVKKKNNATENPRWKILWA